MIVKTSNPLSPDVAIRFDGVEVDYTSVASFTLNLDEGQHDTCVIEMRGMHPKAITDYINAPVRVTLSSGEYRKQEFCGYVMYVEPTSVTRDGLVNGSPFQNAKIVCFGTSVTMRGGKTRVWEDTSISVLAQHMANTYRFSLDSPKDAYTFPRLVQKEESDWQFLTRAAAEYGYRVTVHGTHMHIWDQTKALGRKASYNVLTTMRKQLDAVPGMILRFEGSFGYVTPDGYATSYKTTIMDKDGVTVNVSSRDLPEHTISGYPANSKYESSVHEPLHTVEEGRRLLEKYNKKSFPFNAIVEVTAGAGIVPGGVVSIDEYNSNFDGLWYVRSVSHEVGGSSYISRLKIARDFTLNKEYRILPVEPLKQPPAPVFINGSWMSESPRVYRYV